MVVKRRCPLKWNGLSQKAIFFHKIFCRFLFGNDDEFSALEYLYRTAKQMAQQKVQINGNISNIRNKPNASKWKHPKIPTKDRNPNLFHNDWQLIDLLNHLEKVDIGIIEDFKVLGMDALLSKQPLYKVSNIFCGIKFLNMMHIIMYLINSYWATIFIPT